MVVRAMWSNFEPKLDLDCNKVKPWIGKRKRLDIKKNRFKNLEFQFQNSLNINKLPQKFNLFDSWGV